MKLVPPYKEQLSVSFENNFKRVSEEMNFLSDEDCKIITNYLTTCTLVDEWLSAIPDPINKSKKIPNRSWTDGTYYWDEMLIHFVRTYKVKLPDNFFTHIMNEYKNERPELDIDEIKINIKKSLNSARKGDISVYDLT